MAVFTLKIGVACAQLQSGFAVPEFSRFPALVAGQAVPVRFVEAGAHFMASLAGEFCMVALEFPAGAGGVVETSFFAAAVADRAGIICMTGRTGPVMLFKALVHLEVPSINRLILLNFIHIVTFDAVVTLVTDDAGLLENGHMLIMVKGYVTTTFIPGLIDDLVRFGKLGMTFPFQALGCLAKLLCPIAVFGKVARIAIGCAAPLTVTGKALAVVGR